MQEVGPALNPQKFANEDPNRFKPETLPKTIQGGTKRCEAPAGWVLLEQNENDCLFAAPVPIPLEGMGTVVDQSAVPERAGRGARCGANPWNARTAVCFGGLPGPVPAGPRGCWQYGPYCYKIPPDVLPDGLRADLANGKCRPDDPNAPGPHIDCSPSTFDQPPAPNLPPSPGPFNPNPTSARSNCGPAAANVAAQLQADKAKLDEMLDRRLPDLLTAGNRFFKGMVDYTSRTLIFLAQEPGLPAAQISAGIFNYLNADHNQNHARLLAAARQAVDQFESDPAYYLGQQAAANCTQAVAARIPALVGGAVSAAQRLGKINSAARTYGSSKPIECRIAGPTGAMRGNPFGSNTNCVATTIAGAKRRVTGRPYTDSDISLEPGPLSPSRVEQLLRENFGNNTYPDLTAERQLLQDQGIPVYSSVPEIENELSRAGSGSGGIVLLPSTNSNEGGHVMGVINEGRGIRFWDDQQGFNEISGVDAKSLADGFKTIFFYRYK